MKGSRQIVSDEIYWWFGENLLSEALYYVAMKTIDINQDKIILKKNQIYFMKYFFVPKNCGIFAKRTIIDKNWEKKENFLLTLAKKSVFYGPHSPNII